MIITSIKDTKHWIQGLETPAEIAGARHLNPALERVRGDLWICWRVELPSKLSRLAFGRLVFQATGGYAIRDAAWLMAEEDNAEDPRLCLAGGKLWLLYSRVRNAGQRGWHVVQCLRWIDPWTRDLGPEIAPRWGRNHEDCEKNWTPFEHQHRLHLHYGPQIGGVWDVEAGREVVPIGSRPLAWPWGYFSGRSQGIAWGDEWLCVGGGGIPHASRGKRYFLGAWTISRESLQIARVGRRPWVWASDDDPALPCPRSAAYNPCVVFTGGAVVMGGTSLLVPVGVHDSWLGLLTVSERDMNLVGAHGDLDHRTTEHEDAVPPPGCRLVKCGRERLAEAGGPYEPGECFFSPQARVEALGPLVSVVR